MGQPLPLRVLHSFRNPVWGLAWLAGFLEERSTAHRHKGRLREYPRYRVAPGAAIARVTSRSLAEAERCLDRAPVLEDPAVQVGGRSARWAGSSELSGLCYAVSRLMRPDVVVETGVGSGVSALSFLTALHHNHRGTLYSVDLPTPNSMGLPGIGHLVPSALRSKWVLTLGPSARVLPEILAQVGTVDIFLHDSRHSYSNQIMEYRLVWDYLRPGGVLISDDVSNDALLEMAERHSVEPIIVGQSKRHPIGMVVKPGDR